jgi:ribose/xylose/arabinose/galactoside ABC-type transport system permease subunit
LVITKLKVFPFIATLATLSIFSGLALSLSAGVPVTGVPADFSDLAYELTFGIPVPVVIAAAVLIVSHVVLTYTRLGRRIYAVGKPVSFASPRDARRTGIVAIFQELMIVGELSVAENVFLGRRASRRARPARCRPT